MGNIIKIKHGTTVPSGTILAQWEPGLDTTNNVLYINKSNTSTENLVGYLPLSAGSYAKLIGNLYINKSVPSIYLQVNDSSCGTISGDITSSDVPHLRLGGPSGGGSIGIYGSGSVYIRGGGEYTLLTAEPSNWTTGWKHYYYLDTTDNTYKALTNDTKPTFQTNKYYTPQGILYLRPNSSDTTRQIYIRNDGTMGCSNYSDEPITTQVVVGASNHNHTGTLTLNRKGQMVYGQFSISGSYTSGDSTLYEKLSNWPDNYPIATSSNPIPERFRPNQTTHCPGWARTATAWASSTYYPIFMQVTTGGVVTLHGNTSSLQNCIAMAVSYCYPASS